MPSIQITRTMLCGAAILFLGSCSGGPQFTGLFSKIMKAGDAKETITQARGASAQGSDYTRALYTAELGYANFEYDEMGDFGSTLFHGERALAAASGKPLEPQSVAERKLPGDKANELSAARERLIAQLGTDTVDSLPTEAAEAHAAYNCWIEQAEENLQPSHIQRCRDRFLASIDTLEQAEAARIAAASASDKTARAEPDFRIAGDGLFNFGDASITPAFAQKLDAIAGEILASAPNQISIVAHTDNVGSDEFNQELSEKRAESVAAYLTGKGIRAEKIITSGLGETSPVDTNDTAVGRSFNRRAEIFLK